MPGSSSLAVFPQCLSAYLILGVLITEHKVFEELFVVLGPMLGDGDSES